jgi:hypothetical protein
MNSLNEVTQSNLFTPAGLLGQVEYSYSAHGTAPSPFMTIVSLVITLVGIVALWKVFTKAGQPGWASIIPIYNLYIWCKIVGRPAWWILLWLICFPIFYIILSIDLAKSFGKGIGFGIGLIFLPFIFLLILGFGSAQYQGPSVAQGAAISRPPQTG